MHVLSLIFVLVCTSLKNKYLVWATGAGQLVASLMSASGWLHHQVFSVLLTWNSSAYAGKHSHGSQNKRSWSGQTCRSRQILQGATARSIPCRCTYWLRSLRVHIVKTVRVSLWGEPLIGWPAGQCSACNLPMLQNNTGICYMTFKP